MKKRFLLIPIVTLPILTIVQTISNYSSIANNKTAQSKANVIAHADTSNYSVVIPELTHYKVGEKLDLSGFKVTYKDPKIDPEKDPEKGIVDVTNECKISMQNSQELTQEGEFDVTIQHNDFSSSFKIYVEKEPHEIETKDPYETLGDIKVKFKLMSNQECIFVGYESGIGTLKIPNYIERDKVKYFIKQIPSDWSDKQVSITGLEFDCKHLRKICSNAFSFTNCFEEYARDQFKLLKFPEGLEEIGECAFAQTNRPNSFWIKGYSFPSTLKVIGSYAFGDQAPYIDGEIQFRSIPTIDKHSFSVSETADPRHALHKCKLVCGSTQEIASQMAQLFRNELSDDFNSSLDFLIPKTIGSFYDAKLKFGEIVVECKLNGEECQLVKYIDGCGILEIPDYVDYQGKKYYINEIPSNCLDGKKEITGLKFAEDCAHLKKICSRAFEGTNCLNGYLNNDNLLQFPEGLEEIGDNAFSHTDLNLNKIKGYSFPSTLKKIGKYAFGDKAPYINGDDDNGVLEFRSTPTLDEHSFYVLKDGEISSKHSCRLVYGSTLEIAQQMSKLISDNHNCDFKIGEDYLLPKTIGKSCETNIRFGDISVKCKLDGDECKFMEYVEGSGTLEITDYIEHDGEKYYIKEIPSNWSNGENNIKGLKFDENCKHLKTICANAFEGTNCLDYYINNKKELLEFPEGLEEIGDYAFYGTDYGQNSIKGYSFPSTLKKIGQRAFSKAPYIDGDGDNGELQFKSVPEIANNAFYICGAAVHDCKYIYGEKQETAEQMAQLFRNELSDDFNTDDGYLIPQIVYDNIENFTWGDIKVECRLIADECLLNKYVSGSGKMVVPDHEEYNGKTYYVREIPSNWSDGENNITGLEFKCTHLKKICDSAFKYTNCLNYYVDNKCINGKPNLLKFPEGLEEIGECAFYGTDYGQNKIKGYSFPSTLKKIGSKAFSKAPYIDGEGDDGILEFRSIPEIANNAFYICGLPDHNCKYIYGANQEIAEQMADFVRHDLIDDFNIQFDHLIPQVIEEKNI